MTAAGQTGTSVSSVAAAPAGTSETISWTTDTIANGRVDYGTSPSALTSSAVESGNRTSHAVTLTGLSSRTTYYFRVSSADSSGVTTTSPDTSSAPASFVSDDTVAPVITGVSVSSAGTSETVTWTTDEAADGAVTYGTSPSDLSSTATSSGVGTSHSVVLTGLASVTTYYYRVVSTDGAGNSTTSPFTSDGPASFVSADSAAPTVSNVAATSNGSTQTITWTTDENSTSHVDYGTSAGSLSFAATSPDTGTSHSVTLSGLQSSATYYFRVTSADPAGNATTSPDPSGAPSSFVSADTAAPVISAIATAPSGTTATVTWTTDEAATGRVDYGTSTALGSSVAASGLSTSHSITLTGLQSSTTYYFRVASADASGNGATTPTASDAPATFVSADTAAPVVSTVGAAPAGSSETVTWTTDEQASTKVDYGTTTALGSSVTVAGLSTAHSATLSGLASSATYYYRVTSTDAFGNTVTSPSTSGAPATFVSADTIAPSVSAVTATPSGSALVITWTTNEPSSNVVLYGTTTALGSTTSAAGQSTSHSVTLTGLAPNTAYYYRVQSADAAGNATTSPATSGAPARWAPTIAPMGDTTVADFSGTNASSYVTQDGDGDVVIAPVLAAEWNGTGTTMPTGWTSTATVTGGKSTLGSGAVTVSGARLRTSATYASPRSIEAKLTIGTNQQFGLYTTSSANVYAYVSVDSSNRLLANVNSGSGLVQTVLQTGWTSARHVVRIEWVSNTAVFWVDGVQKLSRSWAHGFTNLVPYLLDSSTTDANLVSDWLRVAPYAAQGVYTSRVLDGLGNVAWDTMTWVATLPSGTTLAVTARSGNSATPDASWSAWTSVASSGTNVNLPGRYFQYQLTLKTTGNRFVSPSVASVQIGLHAL